MTNKHPHLGSDIFCKALADEGMDTMFGIPGGVVLPLYDKINQYGHKIRHILPRQEQGGGFAADGYARATGKVGVALGTSGPGATNLMTSIANSMMDSVPTVYITGQVVEEFIGTDAFQETDVIGMTMPIVKHSYLVNKAKEIPRIVKEAFYLASTGRPGPVHIDLVKDVWFQEAPYDENPQMDLPGYNPIPETCTDRDIKKFDAILERDNIKPVIIAGHGVEISRAQKELVIFAEKHNLPVVTTLLGMGNFPQGHKNWIGMIGMHGDAVANYAVHNANLIIGIGCRFDDRITGKLETFIKDKTFVHLEIDPSEIGKIVPTELPLPGDIKEVLTRANHLLSPHENLYENWWSQIAAWKNKYGFLDFTINKEARAGYLSQPRVVKMISDITQGEAIVAGDVGRHQMWLSRFYRFKHPNSHLSSGGLGSMGYGMPAAMGAKVGCLEREVWSVSGDGGFMMNVQEMGTLAEYNIPVKMCIMEDSALGMVRQWQNLLFKGNISHSEFKNPDFVKLADAFGIPAWRARTYAEAEHAIKEARKVDGPTLITFMVDPDEHVYPMVPPNTALGDQALCDEDLLKDKSHKYKKDDLLQGHT
ncbi:biosynthetic-type acetolactate synthase large subunit [Candidatus Peregrinibacteria bacterium]|nr:biosynthetic-type acetolactate synthase large subunit [Candidatus Peregrinibacteria bacterium]